jgi:AraC family cel operon transcriptional repressor
MDPAPLIPLAAVAAGRPVYALQRLASAGGWSFHRHSHRGFCELVFVQQGEVRQVGDDGELRLGPGALMLVRERDRHALAAAGTRLRYYNLTIPTAEWWRLDSYLGEPGLIGRLEAAPAPPLAQLPAARAAVLAEELDALFLDQHRAEGARRRLAVLLLAWLPALAAEARAAADPRPAWLLALLDEIEARLEQGLAAADLPRRAGVSAAHLARSFRRHLGCTPSAWLTRRRIERAALLLARGDRPLGDIAAGLGFASRSWFQAEFRRQLGEPPAAWRRRHQG